MRKILPSALCLTILLAHPAWARDTQTSQVEVLAQSGYSWNGDALPAYPDGAPEVTILRITIPPGVRLPLHKHTVINAGVLLKGKLKVETPDGEVLHLSAGDTIVELVNKMHFGINEGPGPAEIIVFYAGVQNLPITIKKAE
jgi:quercetin dioxygenase-like cupin family protein